MSVQSIPKLLKPQTLAKDNQTLDGTIPLDAFARLVPSLASTEGEVKVSMRFSRLSKGHILLDLKVEGMFPLICQRCLEPYQQFIGNEVKLCPIHEDAQDEELPEGHEPVLLEQGNLNIYSMIEDEILLSLPTIPCHPFDECPAKDKVAEEGQEIKKDSNPPGQFAILANLKKHPS